jgi:hypothetical protein
MNSPRSWRLISPWLATLSFGGLLVLSSSTRAQISDEDSQLTFCVSSLEKGASDTRQFLVDFNLAPYIRLGFEFEDLQKLPVDRQRPIFGRLFGDLLAGQAPKAMIYAWPTEEPMSLLSEMQRRRGISSLKQTGQRFSYYSRGKKQYAEAKNGYLMMTESERNLTSFPSDPSVAFKTWFNRYDLTVSIRDLTPFSKIFAEDIQKLESELKTAFEQSQDQQLRESIQKARRSKETFDQTEEIVLGINHEPLIGRTSAEFAMRYTADAKSAERIATRMATTSRLNGYSIPDEVVRIYDHGSDNQRELAVNQPIFHSLAEAIADFDQTSPLAHAVARLIKTLPSHHTQELLHLQSGRELETLTIIEHSSELAEVLLQAFESSLPNSEYKVTVQRETEVVEDVTLHDVVQSYGDPPIESLRMCVGLSANPPTLFFATGADAHQLLKNAILNNQPEKNTKDIMTIAKLDVSQFMTFLSQFLRKANLSLADLGIQTNALKVLAERDSVLLTIWCLPRGEVVNLTVESDVAALVRQNHWIWGELFKSLGIASDAKPKGK